MPSADSPYAINSPCGSLTRCSACFRTLALCSSPDGVWLVDGQGALSNQRLGFYFTGFPCIPVVFKRQLPPRHLGPPGVSSDYFQRTIVRYTGIDLMTDRGLYPVLRTRPDLSPPQICLPSTLSGYGAYLYVDPRFCLRLPSGVHCCNTLAFGYPSPLSGWVWTLSGNCVIILPDITI